MKVTYDDKVGQKAKKVRINQVWDEDMNEIKEAINDNDDNITSLGADLAILDSRVLVNEGDISDEVTRATAAEQQNASDITNLEAANVVSDARIDALKLVDIDFEDRIADLETTTAKYLVTVTNNAAGTALITDGDVTLVLKQTGYYKYRFNDATTLGAVVATPFYDAQGIHGAEITCSVFVSGNEVNLYIYDLELEDLGDARHSLIVKITS